MGTIKTTNIEPIADNGTVTLGSSGDQFTLATGAKSSFLYPAFEAYLSSNQTVSDGVDTKVQFDTEVFDTNNCYDNSTNYRFTPNVAGKYMIYGSLRGSANTNLSNLQKVITFIFKNGSQYNASQFRIDFRNNNGTQASTPFSQVLEFNGTSDYVEIFAHTDVSADTPIFQAQSTFFGAYRIGS